jgi:hypothetical protein
VSEDKRFDVVVTDVCDDILTALEEISEEGAIKPTVDLELRKISNINRHG